MTKSWYRMVWRGLSEGVTCLLVVLASLACGFSTAFAQENGVDCDAVYADIVDDYPIDLASCKPTVAPYTLDECKPPSGTRATRPSSHLILAIDASGSMAGQVGGETKMEAAKREAVDFLRDVPEEIKVGLVVYGHRGNNQTAGKAESCAATELVHSFDTSRRRLVDSVKDLSPTGWTPLGGVLGYAADVVGGLPTPRDGDLAPVVYLISDGEETCGGDPVAAAGKLSKAGVKTVVHTIGFDVDAETEAQLQAIAYAAEGNYYAASDAQSLRRELNEIKEAEDQLARYKYCVQLNSGAIAAVYHNARIELAGCFQRNNPQDRQLAVLRAMKAATEAGEPTAACAEELNARARGEAKSWRGWLSEQTDPLTDEPLRLIEEYRESTRLEAR